MTKQIDGIAGAVGANQANGTEAAAPAVEWDTTPRIPLSEAARDLGVAHATLTKQAHSGRLWAVKVGPIYLTSRAEIERYRIWSKGRPGRKSEGEQ